MFAQTYMETVEKAITAVLERSDSIHKAAELIAQAVGQGKKVFVTDRHGIVEFELAEKPGNLALLRSLQRSVERMAEGDVLILSSLLPHDERDVEIAAQTRAMGVKLITICPEGRLAESADIAVFDQGIESNAILTSPGLETPFGPMSGIIHVLILNLIQADATEILLAANKAPTVLPGGYLAGGQEKLIAAQRTFTSRGF